MLSIRPANAGDVPVLNTMIHEFAEFEHLPVVVTEASLLRDGFGERPKFRVLMAEWDGQPAGYAFFFDYYSTFEGRAGIFLEDIYVREQYRGKEIGKALLAQVASIARAGELLWRALAGARLEHAGDRVLSQDSALTFWMSGRPSACRERHWSVWLQAPSRSAQ